MTRSEVYDFLYREGEMIFAEYNLCDVRNGQCKDHRTQIKRQGGYNSLDLKSFCCSNCNHLSPTGCKVKALYCKLWFCDPLLSKPIYRRLNALKNVGYAYKIMKFRASKEESLE